MLLPGGQGVTWAPKLKPCFACPSFLLYSYRTEVTSTVAAEATGKLATRSVNAERNGSVHLSVVCEALPFLWPAFLKENRIVSFRPVWAPLRLLESFQMAVQQHAYHSKTPNPAPPTARSGSGSALLGPRRTATAAVLPANARRLAAANGSGTGSEAASAVAAAGTAGGATPGRRHTLVPRGGGTKTAAPPVAPLRFRRSSKAHRVAGSRGLQTFPVVEAAGASGAATTAGPGHLAAGVSPACPPGTARCCGCRSSSCLLLHPAPMRFVA